MTDASAQHVRAAAQVIAGTDEPPEWLLGAVARIAHELGYVIETDARILKRTDLRQQIAAIRDASMLLDVLLFPFMHGGKASLLLSDHLLQDGEHRLEYEGELHRVLEDLSGRCVNALNRIPEGAGQNRTLSRTVETSTTSSSTVCAMAMQLIWNEFRGQLPGLQNHDAQRACSELWLAAGGKGTKLAGWRTAMEEARKAQHQRVSSILAQILCVQGIHPETP